MSESPNKTSLHDQHVRLGAKMAPFAGFEMPIHYSGIIDEHTAVREAAGLFDLSHMGEFIISGGKAEDFLQRMTINDVAAVQPGQAQYTAMCREDGGIIDDCVMYRFEHHFLLVVNASNIEKDLRWLEDHLGGDVSLEDRSDNFSLIAVQGPKSLDLLCNLVNNPDEVSAVPFYWHCPSKIAGIDVICARTGYTGELGYELYVEGDGAENVWKALMREGGTFGAKPVGLGARDTLRLEMKYCLYGNDIDETTNPIEAGLGWITKLEKGDFVGREAVSAIRAAGPSRKLIGFELSKKGIARHGYSVMSDGEVIGKVTSGSHSPSLGKSIGMAYLSSGHSRVGTEIYIDVRGRELGATVVKTPFWKNGTAGLEV